MDKIDEEQKVKYVKLHDAESAQEVADHMGCRKFFVTVRDFRFFFEDGSSTWFSQGSVLGLPEGLGSVFVIHPKHHKKVLGRHDG